MEIFVWPGLLLVSTILLTRWLPRHPRWRPLVIVLNLVVSVRYLWWRGFETLNWDSGWGMAVSLTTYAAELYGFLVVLHHYAIATRSLDRSSKPPDAAFSPSVDILVPSYNEGADILTRTLVGCQAIEYPNKRVYLLDDKRRPEIADLCRTLGVNYIKRDDNRGAKAGNLNNALEHVTGDFLVTFDADHIPVSSFLNETLGHFRDSRVALVQTAHHFFNPDVFQGQLRSQEYIANEQDMFYHVVQPGRDVYNSSFYCGSGAVFRRAAIDEIGGFPTTTVTEDIHTTMLLQSRGWHSVYVNKDLSAGLAPESFDAYLTQRKRWSKGTMQVMLTQRGLFLPGLTLAQRVNYFATLWYWLYGLPRMVYLLAPLTFLLLGLQPLIVDDMTDLLTYYVPHLVVSVAAFQLVNKGMRRIFWSDIYESCIAVQMAMTTIAFPWSGKKVHFAVTPKGKEAEQRSRQAGWALGWPLLVLSALLVAGLVKGAFALTMPSPDRDSTYINLFWSAYNLLILSFGLLLLKQQPQRRGAPRLARTHACKLSWPNGTVDASLADLSETGLRARLSRPQPLPREVEVLITSKEGRSVTLRARLIRSELQNGEVIAAVHFLDRTLEQHRQLIELMYSAPDSWEGEHGRAMGSPEHVRRVLASLIAIFSRGKILRRQSPRFECDFNAALAVPGQRDAEVRAVDVSYSGVGIVAEPRTGLRVGVDTSLTLQWNEYESTTFQVRVANVAADGTRLGLAFQRLNAQQKDDLIKHLDSRGHRVSRERRAA